MARNSIIMCRLLQAWFFWGFTINSIGYGITQSKLTHLYLGLKNASENASAVCRIALTPFYIKK